MKNHNKKNFILFFLAIWLVAPAFSCHIAMASESSEVQGNQLPEGENLLLRPKVGRVVYEYNIYALSQDNTLYYSLADMIDILEFAINFDEASGRGQGWFLREDWKIFIDLKNNQIVSRDQVYTLTADSTVIQKGVLFIEQNVLAQIFNMQFKADIAQQYLEIDSPYPLPGVARYYRQNKTNRTNGFTGIAQLPRKEIQYDWFDINTADVRLGARYRRKKGIDSDTFSTGSLAIEGQLLKHEAYVLTSADSLYQLNTVVARLSKSNEDAVLLGPLKARKYTLGDTDLTDLPLTGDSTQELGFHVSNSRLDNVQFQSTDISGDALPGWDVELYRNGILVSSLIIGNDGFYEFADVQLFGGDNEFELFFYGPQGEIRNRQLNVPVTAELLAAQDSTYDVSVSLSETRTFQKNQVDDDDRDTPHVVARYNKSFGDTLGYLGLRNRDIEGDNKTFLGTGFTSLVKNTIIDGNFGIDDEANTAARLTARKNINDWNLSLSGLVQDEDYLVGESLTPKTLIVTGNVQKSHRFKSGSRGTVFTNAEYSETSDNREQKSGRLGASFQKGPLNFSDVLFYESADQLLGGSQERIDNNFSVRGSFGKYFVRAGVDYDIHPVSQVDRYYSQMNYYPTSRLSGDLRVDHEPNRDFTEMRLGLNYVSDYYRTSPYVEIDNQNEVIVGLNLNFDIVDTPHETRPLITSDRVIGRGLVSSFVFHDKNGNNTYDEGDEPLPDVIVESVNVRRRIETNEKGYSLINNLPTSRATDIRIDHLTLPDPYMISGTEGVSIFPSAGEIVELNFPVHMSGEIDGTISVKNKKGAVNPLKQADVLLYPVDTGKTEEIKTRAAFDGFFVASQVPPGQYLMVVSNETAKRARASLPPPRFVNFGYDGDTIYSSNFELDKKHANVPIDVVYNENSSSELIYGLKTKLQPQTKLLSLFRKLKRRNSQADIYAGLEELTSDEAGTKIYKLPSNDLSTSHEKCRELAKNAVSCVLQIYIPSKIEAIQTAQTSLL